MPTHALLLLLLLALLLKLLLLLVQVPSVLLVAGAPPSASFASLPLSTPAPSTTSLLALVDLIQQAGKDGFG